MKSNILGEEIATKLSDSSIGEHVFVQTYYRETEGNGNFLYSGGVPLAQNRGSSSLLLYLSSSNVSRGSVAVSISQLGN